MKYNLMAMLFAFFMAFTLAACGGGEPAPAEPAAEAEPAEEPAAEAPAEDEDTDAASADDANAILQSTLLALSQLDNYQADMTLEFSGEASGAVSMQVFVRGSFLNDAGGERPDFKAIVTESSLAAIPADTVAILGETNYVYDPVQNVVLTSGPGEPVAYSELYTMFLGNQTRAVTLISPGVTTPEIVGEAEVGPFQTTQIALNPTEVTGRVLAPGAQGTIWIDQETNLPVQLEYSEDGFSASWVVSSLSLEPLDDAVFDPGESIPADAQTVAASEISAITEFESVDDATAAAGFTPLLPAALPGDLPAEPSSIGVQETPLGPLMTLVYAVTTEAETDIDTSEFEDFNPIESTSITIRALQNDVGFPSSLTGVTSEVSIRGQDATLVEKGDGFVTMTWVEDGVFYTITSNGFGQDDVIAVAESMEGIAR